MRKIIFLIFIIPFIGVSQVNENNKLPDLTPVSPKSFEFLKYGEIPVGKYTGVPNISIPIYTINAKGLDVPIQLSYHANGFRVNEEAGWTGLGWSLSGGGSIVQVVNSFDDFGQYHNRTMIDYAGIFNIQMAGSEEYEEYGHPPGCGECIAGEQIFGNCEGTLLTSHGKFNKQALYLSGVPGYYYIPVDLLEGKRDFEPDIFKFNMPGYSGEFVLDWETDTFICLTDNKVKIEKDAWAPNMLTIMVPEGHKYIFQLKESTVIISNSSTDEYNPTSPSAIDVSGTCTSRVYQLVTIRTNQGDIIEYEYLTTGQIENYANISKSITRYINSTNADPFPDYLNTTVTSFNYTEQSYSYIRKITFNGGTLLFSMSDRIDQVGSKKLDKIDLKKDDNVSVAPTKTINFSYDYFIGHTNGTNEDQYLNLPNGTIKTAQELTHRLKLISVQETGFNPYLFEYNTEPLPKKTSLATDYWGYYNGVLTNVNSFPNAFGLGIQRGNHVFEQFEQNNKGSRLQHTKASVLEKITYPTKGFTTFDYELNTFVNASNIPPFDAYAQSAHLVNSRSMGGPPQKIVKINHDGTVCNGAAILSTRGCLPGELINGANDNTYIRINAFKSTLITYVENHASYAQYGMTYVLAVSGLLDGSNQALYDQHIDSVVYLSKDAMDEEKLFHDLRYVFNKGIIVITASGGCGTYNGTVNSSMAQINLNIKDYYPTNPTEQGAGLRVKEINSYTGPNSTAAVKKTYHYTGGIMMSRLKYYNTLQLLDYDWTDLQAGPQGTVRHSSGFKHTLSSNSFIAPSSSASGNHVGYDMVDEYVVNPQTVLNEPNTGRISETYINDPDYGSYPVMNYGGTKQLANGLVWSRRVFDKDNKLLHSLSNAYNTHRKEYCTFGMKSMNDGIFEIWQANHQFFYYTYDVLVYPLRLTNIELLTSTTIDYSGNEQLKTVKEFEYNIYNQLIYTKETASNNDVIETFLSYPKDFAAGSGNTIAQQMAASNVLAPLITKKVKVNNELISSEEYEYYKRLGSNNAFYLTDIYSFRKYKAAKSSDVLEDRVLCNYYDGLGNLLEAQLPEGMKTSYIWGYDRKHIIAKIENAGVGEIPLNLQTIAVNASIQGSEEDLIDALNDIRNAMPNALVSTYTYKPLVGISTMTDPRGNTIKYFYDDYGRLEMVKDSDNNILSENNYHLKP